MGGPPRVLAVLAATLVALTAVFVSQAEAAASTSLGPAGSARQQLNLDLLDDLLPELAQDQKMGVDALDSAPLQAEAESVQLTLNIAHSPQDFRHAFSEMGAPIDQAEQLRIARAADVAAVQSEADRLVQATAGGLDALRQ